MDRSRNQFPVDTEEIADAPVSNTRNEVPLSTSSTRQSTLTVAKLRQELVWKVADCRDADLKEISRQYKLLLDGRSHWRWPIRQFWAPRTCKTNHQCTDYRQEEVTLTHVALNNRVLVCVMPSIDEVCLVCGKHIWDGFKCDICGTIINRKDNFRRHMEMHEWGGRTSSFLTILLMSFMFWSKTHQTHH